MKHLFKLSLLLLVFLLPAIALAHDFEIDGIYYNINGNEAIVTGAIPYTVSVTIPATVTNGGNTYTVTSIGSGAFGDCRYLTSIDLPNSVTSIGNEAFCGCGFTSIVIPNSVTYIGKEAFSWCTSLTSVDIPNSVTSIGDGSFYGCTGLTCITIPNSVTSIGKDSFSWCTGLTSVTVANGNPKYDSRNNCNAIIETVSNTLIAGCKSTVIPNSVTSIGDGAFYGCTGLTRITIPNSVTSIGWLAFSESGLTSITIPSAVTTICDGAFYYCLDLKEVYSYITDLSQITMGNGVFVYDSVIFERILYVPFGTSASYQADNRWSDDFGSIVEMEPVPIESIHLNVTTAGLNEGATLQLSAMVLPEEGTSKKMNWASSNPSVATVDDNGLVTTHGVGTVTITAMTTDGSNLSASCIVTLLPVGIKGDMDGNGQVNINDVTDLIDVLLNGNR